MDPPKPRCFAVVLCGVLVRGGYRLTGGYRHASDLFWYIIFQHARKSCLAAQQDGATSRRIARDGAKEHARQIAERLQSGLAGREDGRPLSSAQGSYRDAFATTIFRQGLSTAIASSEARMLAPAAIRKTWSQLPLDCWT